MKCTAGKTGKIEKNRKEAAAAKLEITWKIRKIEKIMEFGDFSLFLVETKNH